jgi:hypothetical protein
MAAGDLKAMVEEIVMEALREVQTLGGYEWKPLKPDTEIIGELEGFDSLVGLEATVLIEKKLTARLARPEPVALGFDTAFVSAAPRRALAFRDVVSGVCGALEATL